MKLKELFDCLVLNLLLAMHERLLAAQAKREFDDAMTAFQAECPVITKGRGVRDGGGVKLYEYAPFEDVIAAVKPFLQTHGFSFDLNTDVESKDGWVVAICTAKHRGGHSESKSVKLPIGSGTRAMSTTQIYAAALSFASRRAFQNAFGIVCAGEDKDGKLPTPTRGPSTGRDDQGKPVDIAGLKRKLRANLDKAGAGDGLGEWEQFLRDNKIIGDSQTLASLTAAELTEANDKVEILIQEQKQ